MENPLRIYIKIWKIKLNQKNKFKSKLNIKNGKSFKNIY